LWRYALAGPLLRQTVSMALRCRQSTSTRPQHTTRLPTVCAVCPAVRAAARALQQRQHRLNGGEEVDFGRWHWSTSTVPRAAARVRVCAIWPAHNIAP